MNQFAATNKSALSALFALSLALIGVGNLIVPAVARPNPLLDYLTIALAICLVFAVHHLPNFIRTFRQPLTLTIFAASLVPGAVGSEFLPYGADKLLSFGIAIILILAVAASPDQGVLQNRVLWILLAFSVIVCILFLLFAVAAPNGRVSLFGMNPIGVARLTALGPVLAVALLVPTSRPKSALMRAMVLAAIPLGFFTTAETGSRGPMLSAAAAIVILLVLTWKRRRIGANFLLLAALAVASAYVWTQAQETVQFERFFRGGDSGRFELLEATMAVSIQHPEGIGWGNASLYLNGFAAEPGGILYPHNIFAEFLLEGGITAVIGFAVLLGAAIRSVGIAVARRAPHALALTALLCYTVINAQFSSDIVGNRTMWLAVALALMAHMAYPRSTVDDRIGASDAIHDH